MPPQCLLRGGCNRPVTSDIAASQQPYRTGVFCRTRPVLRVGEMERRQLVIEVAKRTHATKAGKVGTAVFDVRVMKIERQ